jgi:Ca-activated chloride channel family protein
MSFASPAASPTPSAPATAGARAPGVPRTFDRFSRLNNGAESYNAITDNPFLNVDQNPLSTFSADVDTASYANVRRFINQRQLPPRDAVRIEEMINYFTYDYPQPTGNNPIGATIEAAAAPWNPQHRLVRVGIKAKDIDVRRRPPSNLVFLLDVSGSMQPAERLPLLKDGIRMMIEQLTANDHVSVVTYAGTTGVALPSTRGDQKDAIIRLIDSLQAGGSTNGGSGIELAYQQATANFIPNGVNRVILATDGDFNVGITDRNQLVRMIEDKAKTGVFLTVLGVGMGNYKDATLEMLADKGHGNYAYLDTLNEARKVLVDQMSSTFVTVAKDVKLQVEFNPAIVGAYRLIGYENRALRNEDFNNDRKDGGDMGAAHTVTVLYEVVPRGVSIDAPGVDLLKYQQPLAKPAIASNETLTVKIRYKEPTASDSKLLVFPLIDREQPFARATADFRFAAAVASFGMILRDSPYKGTASFDSVLAVAEDSMGSDRSGYRREFMQIVQQARQIRGR